jgi:hypothetical protein
VAALGRLLIQKYRSEAQAIARATNRRAEAMRAGGLLAGIVVALLVGGVASWLAFGQPLNAQCHDERGGRWCGYWLTPPAAAAK